MIACNSLHSFADTLNRNNNISEHNVDSSGPVDVQNLKSTQVKIVEKRIKDPKAGAV